MKFPQAIILICKGKVLQRQKQNVTCQFKLTQSDLQWRVMYENLQPSNWQPYKFEFSDCVDDSWEIV
tara:strand:+ start:411 stop:611 length:201 start_codon:yes stop_codon:yes gene_type:complete